MPQLQSELLFTVFAGLAPPIDIGPSGAGHMLPVYVTGGSFTGPRLRGKVLPGGGDWLRLRADGSGAIDVRICLQTDDGATIFVSYGGRLVIPPEIFAQVMDFGAAQAVDPSRYYFRTNPLFETGSADYAWLNNVVAVGQGRIGDGGVTYEVFAIT
ncbi:DUF3237 domain-containing protein [Oleomonas cavernae]|uniref:UPF0311 protein D3874_02860 n=1 Tax=Oleomonas cavernae TaxID=2320859 RepID=A0A418WU35_9PROT|nr:DUF3237 domain-containing protein [Oleomonas cavernae]RJF94772.1 DUF3237 domain-containing protein [Oleomonas cavernae]